jgi:hypothetical protein
MPRRGSRKQWQSVTSRSTSKERVEVALAELRQSLHGCLNGDGMTTTGSIDNVHFAMACKRVKGL